MKHLALIAIAAIVLPLSSGAKPDKAMFKKADTIWCNASDMKRSVAFYRDALGLKLTYESSYWSSFDLGNGLQLGLHGGEAVKGGSGFVFGFISEDLKALRTSLTAAGAKVEPGYHNIPRGVVMDISDPDGNRLQATQLGVKSKDLEN